MAKQHIINIKPLSGYFKSICSARQEEKPPVTVAFYFEFQKLFARDPKTS